MVAFTASTNGSGKIDVCLGPSGMVRLNSRFPWSSGTAGGDDNHLRQLNTHCTLISAQRTIQRSDHIRLSDHAHENLLAIDDGQVVMSFA